MRTNGKRMMAITLCLAMVVSTISFNAVSEKKVKAEVKGSLANEVTGTWSYWDGSQDVVQSNAMLLDKLPTIANQNKYRFTTKNYDDSYGAFLSNGWSTSMSWNYSKGDGYGNALYAIPMAYLATSTGMLMINPFTRLTGDTGTFLMNQDNTGYLSDFIIGTGSELANTKTDVESDWSTKIRMEQKSDASKYIDFTLTHGSPFTFCELNNVNTASVEMMRDLPADVVYYNGTSINNSDVIIIRKYDNGDEAIGLTNYDYYAFYMADGATNDISGTNVRKGSFNIDFSNASGKYFTIAWLCDTKGADDSKAISIASDYKDYAFNFIIDTKATYVYDADNSTVTTRYEYKFDKKKDGSPDGTIMGVIPHQYKNMSGYDYLNQTSRSIRGTVKFLKGSAYETVQKYTGVLPNLGTIPEADKPKIKSFVQDFMDEYGPTDTAVTKEKYDINTYDCGKKLNRAVQVMLAAEAVGDNANAKKLLAGIKAELADWFSADRSENDKYFYYYKDLGVLFGFPQAYYTVDGLTDHAFHYGYFINAAAQVALRDDSFVEEYGNVIDELIGDIATTTRNNPDSKYPYLRQFDIWEGHSWASGHGDFGDGNNQESSSEAINGWAGLILYGQATGNQELTDAGVYLYTTEVESVSNYWFDYDDDTLSSLYKKTIGGKEHRYASMVWGGKYGYETWWTLEPLQTNGINILPNTPASFYLARDKEYMRDFVRIATKNESSYTGSDKDVNRWNELYSSYIAMYDPDAAEEYFNETCKAEAGDSKAHTYYQIKYMQDKGTPDLTTTGNMPLSSVLVKNGSATYVVYNPTDSDKEAVFSDGTSFTAKAGKLTEYTIEKPTTTAAPTTTRNPLDPTTTAGPTTKHINPEEGFIKLSDDLWYKKLEYGVVGMNDPELLDAGATLQFAFAPTSNTKVYMDGVEVGASDDRVILIANNIVKLNPTKLADDAYTTVKIQADSGTTEVILKRGNPVIPTEATSEIITTKAETTKAETTKAETTKAETTKAETTKTETTTSPSTSKKETTVPVTTQPDTKSPVTETATSDQHITTAKSKVPTAVIKKATKSKKSRKAVVTIKRVKGVDGYQLRFYKTKKAAKKHLKPFRRKLVKKFSTKVSVYRKSFKGVKKLYVIARLFRIENSRRIYGSYSKVKKVKIK